MRRKSERTKKAKDSPDKTEKSKRSRTSRRKKASSGSEADSADEVPIPEVTAEPVPAEPSPESTEAAPESQSGDEVPKVWQVKAADESTSDKGEIKKLKICLSTRMPVTPEPEPRSRKKLNRTMSSNDMLSEGAEEKRRNRHRSRRSTRDSKDDTDRSHEARSEEEGLKTSKSKINAEENTSTVKKTTELVEPVSTAEHPESTTDEVSVPVQSDIDSSKKDEPENNSSNTEVVAQTDTTEKNHSKQPETPRPRAVRRSRRLSRNSSERELSPEQSETEKPKLRIISEEPELNQKRSKSPIVLEADPDAAVESHENSVRNNPDSKSEESKPEESPKSPVKEKTEETSVTKSPSVEPEKTAPADKIVTPEHIAEKPSYNSQMNDDSLKSPTPKIPEYATQQSESDEVFERKKSRVSISEKQTVENSTSKKEFLNHTAEDTKEDGEIEEVTKNTEESETLYSTPIVVSRKRRWGSRASKASQPRPVSISTDVLKDIIPDVKPAELEEVIREKKKERRKSEPSEKVRVERPVLPKIVIDNSENANLHRQEREKERKEKKIETPLMEHRKISLVKEDNFVGRPPSPPRHKSSCILFITNLVRPFTLAQLKNLLQRTGKVIPEGFWIDRIKSKCFVTYENEDQAIETRHALHGVTWPVSNPKTLQVDFSSQEALDRTRSVEAETKDQVSAIPGTVEDWLREQDAKKDKLIEAEESKPWDRKNIVREWDMGKGQKEKERQKREERPVERRRRKSSERSPEPARKFKKKEEEAPAKMLDDLFRKTKTVPCIYWLPLSTETIAVKEEQRRQHMAEHERRMQELERSRTHRRH